jgi:hypothetical protein
MYLGSMEKFDNDDVKYIRSAWILLDKGTLIYESTAKPTVYIMPGLSIVLYLFMIVFGKVYGILAYKIFQLILQVLSIYLVFLIARKVFNSKVAIVSCLINSIYAAELFSVNLVLMESIFKFLLLLLVYISINAIETHKIKLYIFGGVVWALACLFRPTIAAFPIMILIMWIKQKYEIKEMLKNIAVVLFVFALIMSPWWIRNYKTFGMFIPFTKSSGNPFLQGTFINYDNSEGWVSYEKSDDALINDKNELSAGIARLKIYGSKNPLKYAFWYTIGKSIKFWYLPFYWKKVLGISVVSAAVIHLVVLLLGIIGVVRTAKVSYHAFFIFSIIAYFNLIYLPYYTFARYSYPLMPLVIIFAAHTILGFYKRVKGSVKVGKEYSISCR